MPTEKVRIGFIGCGRNGLGHIARLDAMEDASLAGVYDVVEAAARETAERFGTRAYTDFRRMLDEEEPDAVGISVPVFAHGQIEHEVVDRGLPFLVEKPVAGDIETARQIEARVREHNLITCVGYQLRYTAAAAAAKAILHRSPARMAVGRYWCGAARIERWHTAATAGGQLVEQATHTIDLMRYLVGEVAEVFAVENKMALAALETPDAHCVAFRFAGGAVGSLSTTWATDLDFAGNTNVLDLFYDRYVMHLTPKSVEVTPSPDEPLPRAEDGSIDRAFVDAVKTGDASAVLSDYSDGVRSLAVSLAANRSAETGRPVRPEAL